MWPFRRKDVERRFVVGKFTLTAQLAGNSGRGMAIEGTVYSDDTPQALNERLDMMQVAVERQRTRCEIPELEAKRDQMAKGLEQAREILAELEERQKNGEQLTSNEKMQIKNMRVSIGKVNEEIEKGNEAIAEARRKASSVA